MLILGHRGLGQTSNNPDLVVSADHPPENTELSFAMALDSGADGVETDVMLSFEESEEVPDIYSLSDGDTYAEPETVSDVYPLPDHGSSVAVGPPSDDESAIFSAGDLPLIHDDPLNLHLLGADRKELDRGLVSKHTMAELRRMDMGAGQGIFSLSGLFELMAGYDERILNIELKGPGTHKRALDIMRRYVSEGAVRLENIVFSSFSFDELEALRAIASDIKIGMLFEESTWPEEPMFEGAPAGSFYRHFNRALVEQSGIQPTSLHPNITDVNDDVLAFARERGCEIFTWSNKGEVPPAPGTPTGELIEDYGREPDVHLITDFPNEAKQYLALQL